MWKDLVGGDEKEKPVSFSGLGVARMCHRLYALSAALSVVLHMLFSVGDLLFYGSCRHSF